MSASARRGELGRKSRPRATVLPPCRRTMVPKARPRSVTTGVVRSVACRPRTSYSRKMEVFIRSLPVTQEGVDEEIEVAVEDALHVGGLRPGARVLHHRIRLHHVVADLAPEVDVLLGLGEPGEARLLERLQVHVDARL